MRHKRTVAPARKHLVLTAVTSTKLALLTLGLKKAAELWQARQQPPPPPSLGERFGGPARLILAAAGVGGAAYFAARRGVMTQVGERLGRSSGNGSEQPISFGGPGEP
jgi:hypothetical protein